MKIVGPTTEDIQKYSKVIDEALADYKTMCFEMGIEPYVDNFAVYLINTLAMRLDGRWRKEEEYYKDTDLARTIANRYCCMCETGSNPVNCKATGCVLHNLMQFAIWSDDTTQNIFCEECLTNGGGMCGAEDDFGLCLKKVSKKILEGKGIYD